MRSVAVVAGWVVLLASALHAQTTQPAEGQRYWMPEYPWHDATPLNVPEWQVSGTAKLTVAEPRVPIGQRLRLRLEFTNTGREWSFYNPFLAVRLVEPVWILSYDPQTHQQLGLTDPWEGRNGFIAPEPTDWVRMPTGASFAVNVEKWAPRGKRLIQIVYRNNFVRPPKGTYAPGDLPGNLENLQDDELFRTNAVLVEGIDAAQPAPSTR